MAFFSEGQTIVALRTSNVGESSFAAMRLRAEAATGYASKRRELLIWATMMIAERKLRRLVA